MVFRKATETDIPAVSQIYELIHAAEDRGELCIGWATGVYPLAEDAQRALVRDDLYVAEGDGRVYASAIINQLQVDVYEGADWEYPAEDDKVLVLHTLCVDPGCMGKGLGKTFVEYYERLALERNCPYLRMDTNAKNLRARAMYKKLGYKEIGIVPCTFNSIGGVNLVLLEKYLG